MALTKRELNERLKPNLNRIYNDNVRINRTEDRKNVDIVNRIVERLLSLMTEVDPLFKCLFAGRLNTGSYYEKIRVKDPTEFDINIVLKLPFEDDDVQVTNTHSPPAFAEFKLKRSMYEIDLDCNRKEEVYGRLLPFFSMNGKLLRTKVRNWMAFVTNVAFSYLTYPPDVQLITVSAHGPAFTFSVYLKNGTKIDLDLVFIIDCTPYTLPPSIDISKRVDEMDSDNFSWFLVPKPCKVAVAPILDGGSDTYWSISFPTVEKKLLKSTGCVRTLIKLIKLLRDRQGWTQIYSYCVTNLFLLALDEYPDEYYWNEYFLGIRFLEMLCRLREATRIGFLPYYFDRKANLFSGINYNELFNISTKISQILTKIRENPDDINFYFNRTILWSSFLCLLAPASMRQLQWEQSLLARRAVCGIPKHRHHPYRR